MAGRSSAAGNPTSTAGALALLEAAASDKRLSESAAANVRLWLLDPRYREYAERVEADALAGNWALLDDVFWTVIPFGTAGRRGRMHPYGTNAINDRTIGESVQGLADYIVRSRSSGSPPRAAVAYDTRHRSREFAQLAAEVFAAAEFQVCLLDGHRSTPELSFTVRQMGCDCGVMISASHNPPSDNAIKVFGSDGGQLRPPHDALVMESVTRVDSIARRPFAEALSSGQIVSCQEEMDVHYRQAVLAQSFPGSRDVKLLYSPLHGVGMTSVLPILQADGFTDVEVYEPHATPDGNFPNVPDGVANPEDPRVFDALVAHADRSGAELVLASDPDADRIGCAARLEPVGPWRTLSGNQIGVLLADYILRRRQSAGTLAQDGSSYIVKTLVTTDMLRRVADRYGVRTIGDVLTGFKWISGVVNELGPNGFVFGCEEAHGYMVGDYIRDKDAAVAAMLLAELAAEVKQEGKSLHGRLDDLYRQVGFHAERSVSRTLRGAQGMATMRAIMERLRSNPPRQLAGMNVTEICDYLPGKSVLLGDSIGGVERALDVPRSDLLILRLDRSGNYAAIRPSGTEPKLKFYLFAHLPPPESQDVEAARATSDRRLARMEGDLLAAAMAP